MLIIPKNTLFLLTYTESATLINMETNIGIIILAISVLGYLSNWLNWRFLNYKFNYWLYYLGAFVHESSHALLCIFTGAKISEYKVFTRQPHVTYSKPKLPLIGNLLISIAPMLGGLVFLFFVNKYFLANNFIIPSFTTWQTFQTDFLYFIKQIDISRWQNIVAIFLFFNVGAMIGPSLQDLKNIWLPILVLIFIPWYFFTQIGFLAITFILINIILQISLILILKIVSIFTKN